MRGLKIAAFPAVLGGLLLPMAAAATTAPGGAFGPEFVVNTIATPEVHRAPAVAGNAVGGFVAVWHALDQSAAVPNRIRARRFSALGLPIGDEITVAAPGANPAVAQSATGDFVVAYLGAGGSLDARLYASDGTATAEAFTIDAQGSTAQPGVGMDADGNFGAVYLKGSGAQQQPVVRLFNAVGAPRLVGGNQDIVVDLGGNCAAPVLAMGLNGHFTVACVVQVGNPAVPQLRARGFAPAGEPLAPALQVNAQASAALADARVAVDASGAFVVAWSFDANSIHARAFGPGGGQPVDEFELAADAGGLALGAVAMDADGDAVVTWDNRTGAAASDVFARRYSKDRVLAAIQQVNSTDPRPHNHQFGPAVALDADGDFEIVWQDGDTAIGSDFPDIRAQRFAGPEDVDLSLTSSDSPDPVGAGKGLLYSFAVSNLHAAPGAPIAGGSTGIGAVNAAIGAAHNVAIQTVLPGNLTFESASGADWVCTFDSGTRQLVCAYQKLLGSVVAAPPVTLAVTAPFAATTLQNTATVRAYQFDSVAGNNSSTVDTAVSASSVTILGASGKPVTFTVDRGVFDFVKAVDHPISAPEGLAYPQGFFAYQIIGLNPGDTVTMTVQLPPGTDATQWLDCRGASCFSYGARFANDIVTLRLVNDGDGDANPAPGILGSVVAPAKPKSTSGGALGWMLLAALSAAAFLRRRAVKPERR